MLWRWNTSKTWIFKTFTLRQATWIAPKKVFFFYISVRNWLKTDLSTGVILPISWDYSYKQRIKMVADLQNRSPFLMFV